jgi:hypothetical protein
MNSQWWTQSESAWDTGEEANLCLDANGWPMTLTQKLAADGTCTATPMFTKIGILLNRDLSAPYYQAGHYDVYYDGACTLSYSFDALVVSQSAGHDVFSVASPTAGGIYIVINGSGAGANYCRNIRVTLSSLTVSYQAGALFNPQFLSVVGQFRLIRFMDWMCTNGSQHSLWSRRPTTTMPFYGSTARPDHSGSYPECLK